MLLAYLPAVIFEAFWEMLNEPARRADTRRDYEPPEGSHPDGRKR
jgi:hypothetical protein